MARASTSPRCPHKTPATRGCVSAKPPLPPPLWLPITIYAWLVVHAVQRDIQNFLVHSIHCFVRTGAVPADALQMLCPAFRLHISNAAPPRTCLEQVQKLLVALRCRLRSLSTQLLLWRWRLVIAREIHARKAIHDVVVGHWNLRSSATTASCITE